MPSGKPRKLTPKVIESYCTARSYGASQSDAALVSGVSHSVIDDWLHKGDVIKFYLDFGRLPEVSDFANFTCTRWRDWAKYEIEKNGGELPKSDLIYAQFATRVREADSTAAISWLKVIDKAANTDPVWAMRFLKLRDPEGYTEKPTTQKLEVRQVTVDMSTLTVAQLEALAAGEPLEAVLLMAKDAAADTDTGASKESEIKSE